MILSKKLLITWIHCAIYVRTSCRAFVLLFFWRYTTRELVGGCQNDGAQLYHDFEHKKQFQLCFCVKEMHKFNSIYWFSNEILTHTFITLLTLEGWYLVGARRIACESFQEISVLLLSSKSQSEGMHFARNYL